MTGIYENKAIKIISGKQNGRLSFYDSSTIEGYCTSK